MTIPDSANQLLAEHEEILYNMHVPYNSLPRSENDFRLSKSLGLMQITWWPGDYNSWAEDEEIMGELVE